MIQYLTHDQIDRRRWDACVSHALNGNVYAWSWYLDIVHPQWEALVEMNEDNYLTIMPLTGKKKCFVSYLCQPFFVQQLGVFSTEPLPSEKVEAFLQAIPQKFALVEIRLNEGNLLPTERKGVLYHRNSLLDLQNDYDNLSSQYHENTRRNLKKSLKSDLRLVKQVPLRQVIELFRADRGASVTHWKDGEYARLERLAERAITSSNAFVYGVQIADNKSIVCGALFMVSHQRVTFLFSGNSVEGKEVQAMTFLLDQVIREYCGRPYTFDFEGSDDDNLARYYLGFGAKAQKYPSFQRYMSKILYFCTKL